MKITLNSRIGSCSLNVLAIADCPLLLGQAAMKQIVFHDSASEAFKEKSAYKRDSVYSDELAEHVSAIIKAKLAAIGFSEISIETAAWEKPSDFSKFEKAMLAIGLDKTAIAETWAKAQAKKTAKEETAPVSL